MRDLKIKPGMDTPKAKLKNSAPKDAESILKKREEARAAAEKAHLPEEENLGDAMESAVERAIAEAKISEPIFQEPVFVEKQEETDEEE